MAGGRHRTGPRLALHAASRHLVRALGRSDEDAMADRTRLSRTQAGSWARSLRRPRMARLSPSRKSLHCGLRIPGLRKGDDSPLRTFSRPARPAIWHSRRLPTQRLCRCVHSATCQTPSQRYVSASHASWFTSCHDAHAADGRVSGRSSRLSDAVGLSACPVFGDHLSNTGDPKTLAPQIEKLKQRFHLDRVVLVGDRGMITEARITEDIKSAGLDWITSLRAPAIKELLNSGALQLTLFDQRDMASITSPDFPGERLVVC